MAQAPSSVRASRQIRMIVGAFLGVCVGIVAMGSFEAMLVPLQNQFAFSVDVVNVLALAVATGSLAILFIAGSLVDRWGARRVLTLGVCAIVLGAVIIMAASGFTWLLAGRIVGGVGGMTMSVASLASLNAEIQDDRKRAHVFGMLAAAIGAAALLSPVLGGGIAQRVSWRLVPLLWIGVAVLTLLLLRPVLTNQSMRAGRGELMTPLAAGLALSGMCLAALLAGSSPRVAVMAIVASIVASIVFALRWRQLRRHGLRPGLDLSIFRSRGTILLIGAMLFVGAVNLSFYATLFLQYRLGLDPAETAGALIVPQSAVILGGLAGGWVSGLIGSLRTTAIALAISVCAALLFLMINESSGVLTVVTILAVLALPVGCITGTLTKSFLDQADPAASGAASSWRQGAWSLGATIGGVATGAIVFGYFTRNWQSALQQAGIPEDLAASAAEAVRGGIPLVQLAATPGFEDLKVASNVQTLLELSASQISTFRLIAALAATSSLISLILVLAAMWRIRPLRSG